MIIILYRYISGKDEKFHIIGKKQNVVYIKIELVYEIKYVFIIYKRMMKVKWYTKKSV